MTETPFQQAEENLQRPALSCMVARYRRALLICVLCGVLAGVAWALLRPVYRASATLIFPGAVAEEHPAEKAASGTTDVEKIELPPLPRTNLTPAMARVLLESRRARNEMLRKLQIGYDLPRRWCPFIPPAYRQQALLAALGRKMHYRSGAGGNLTITACDTSPELAQRMVKLAIEELDSLIQNLKLDASKELQAFLERKITEQEGIIIQLRQARAKFAQDNNIVSLPEQTRTVATRYASLQNERMQAILDADLADRRAKMLIGATEQSLRAFIDPLPGKSGPIDLLYAKVTALRAELALLRAKLMDDSPEVLAKAREMKAAEELLVKETKRQLDLLPAKSHPAVVDAVTAAMTDRARVSGVDEALKALAGQMKLLPQELMIDTKLAADIDAHRAASKFYRDALLQARLTSAGQLFSVLDHPERPVAPLVARLLMLLGGVLLGLLIGVLIPVTAWLGWRPAQVEVEALPESGDLLPAEETSPLEETPR
ncbi:MAG: GumC domain-containing protein [Armatimonadota bacterium]